MSMLRAPSSSAQASAQPQDGAFTTISRGDGGLEEPGLLRVTHHSVTLELGLKGRPASLRPLQALCRLPRSPLATPKPTPSGWAISQPYTVPGMLTAYKQTDVTHCHSRTPSSQGPCPPPPAEIRVAQPFPGPLLRGPRHPPPCEGLAFPGRPGHSDGLASGLPERCDTARPLKPEKITEDQE